MPSRHRVLSLVAIAILSMVIEGEGAATHQAGDPVNQVPVILPGSPAWTTEETRIPPLVLPDGRFLVVVQANVYMLTHEGKVAWSYSAEAPLTAQPSFDANRNEIGIVGLDLMFQRLSAEKGDLLWTAKVGGGRSVYRQVEVFGDGYLVVSGMDAYRRDGDSPYLHDQLIYWKGNNMYASWSIDFPKGAELVVVRDRIFALSYEEGNDGRLEEIIPVPRQDKLDR